MGIPTSSNDNSCDWSVGIETSLDDLGPTEKGVSLEPVRSVGGGVLGEGRLCHRDTLTYSVHTNVQVKREDRVYYN